MRPSRARSSGTTVARGVRAGRSRSVVERAAQSPPPAPRSSGAGDRLAGGTEPAAEPPRGSSRTSRPLRTTTGSRGSADVDRGERRRRGAGSFDELAFLSSVVGKPATAGRRRQSVPEGPLVERRSSEPLLAPVGVAQEGRR